jgi:6-phosphogluconate dehydrogenase
MHVGPGGAGNFVKMVHNGIEYGDMQLISEAYDILRTVGGFTNDELAETFTLWNKVPLDHNASYLVDMKNDEKRWMAMHSQLIAGLGCCRACLGLKWVQCAMCRVTWTAS